MINELFLEGIVKAESLLLSDDGNILDIQDEIIKHNLVTYDGRDFCARSIGSTEGSDFINLISVGGGTTPPTLGDTGLEIQYVSGTNIDSTYQIIDSRVLPSASSRGEVTFSKTIYGNQFVVAPTLIWEAGLFIEDQSSVGNPLTYNGNDWMFSRVVFDSAFTVYPFDGSVQQGFRISWTINF